MTFLSVGPCLNCGFHVFYLGHGGQWIRASSTLESDDLEFKSQLHLISSVTLGA